jgi:hypothetical protein
MNRHDPHSHPIAVFSHVPKTGGMTLVHLLRRNLGLKHLEVLPVGDWVYRRTDLVRDLRLAPWIVSVAGHGLRPHVDFGDLAPRLRWYTILRDPVERCISNYQHHVEKKASEFDFIGWMRHAPNRNWQVRMFAGEQDLAAAKENLARMACVGLLERYNEFLLLLRRALEWKDFDVAYIKRRNPAKSGDVRRRIKEEMHRYEDEIRETNELDLQLYAYARDELYPQQVAAYGRDRLEADLQTEFSRPREGFVDHLRHTGSTAVCKVIYPRLSRLVAGRRRTSD